MKPAETFSITADDGHRFEASLHATADPTAPVLLFLPALGTPGRVYRGFATALAAQGVQVCITDWRGMASSSVRASRGHNHGYQTLVETDVTALLAQLARRVPQAALWVGGHSLGGQLATLLAARQSPPVRGLVLVASGSVYRRCYSPGVQIGIRFLGLMAAITGALIGHFPGRRFGFGGREARGVMDDWLHVARTGRYEPAGSTFDYETALRRLTLPVLALNFRRDTWAPEAAARHLLDKLAAADRHPWIWGDAETDGQPLDHFSWARKPDLVAAPVAQWIHQHRTAHSRESAPNRYVIYSYK